MHLEKCGQVYQSLQCNNSNEGRNEERKKMATSIDFFQGYLSADILMNIFSDKSYDVY